MNLFSKFKNSSFYLVNDGRDHIHHHDHDHGDDDGDDDYDHDGLSLLHCHV